MYFAEVNRIQLIKLRNFLSNLTYIETRKPLANVLKVRSRDDRINLYGKFVSRRNPEEVVAYYKGMIVDDGWESFNILKNANGTIGGSGNIDDGYLFYKGDFCIKIEIVSNYDKSVLSQDIKTVYRIYAGERRYLYAVLDGYDTDAWHIRRRNQLRQEDERKQKEEWEKEPERIP
jgi:hypothetical protein